MQQTKRIESDPISKLIGEITIETVLHARQSIQLIYPLTQSDSKFPILIPRLTDCTTPANRIMKKPFPLPHSPEIYELNQ